MEKATDTPRICQSEYLQTRSIFPQKIVWDYSGIQTGETQNFVIIWRQTMKLFCMTESRQLPSSLTCWTIHSSGIYWLNSWPSKSLKTYQSLKMSAANFQKQKREREEIITCSASSARKSSWFSSLHNPDLRQKNAFLPIIDLIVWRKYILLESASVWTKEDFSIHIM